MEQLGDTRLPSDLPAKLRRELTLALGSKRHTPEGLSLEGYITWLQAAIGRAGLSGDSAQAVYDEWLATRPRCARRALAASSRAHA